MPLWMQQMEKQLQKRSPGLDNFLTGCHDAMAYADAQNLTLDAALQYVPQEQYILDYLRSECAGGKTPFQALTTTLLAIRDVKEAALEAE